METREQARQAAAKAAGQELLDENVKKAQVIQAKTKFNASKTKMKSATNQIKTALEEFKELKDADPSDKEAAALLIQSSWKGYCPAHQNYRMLQTISPKFCVMRIPLFWERIQISR